MIPLNFILEQNVEIFLIAVVLILIVYFIVTAVQNTPKVKPTNVLMIRAEAKPYMINDTPANRAGFTKEVKDKWLMALKSGDYVQGTVVLVSLPKDEYNRSGVIEHCCLGVLGDICPWLINTKTSSSNDPYYYIEDTHSYAKCTDIIAVNDKLSKCEPNNYSNIIPLLATLPTLSLIHI